MLHKFDKCFWCSDKRELRDGEEEHTERNLYLNHADTFLDSLTNVRDNLVEIQNITLVMKARRLFSGVSMKFLVKKTKD